jgi:hypothetical protein
MDKLWIPATTLCLLCGMVAIAGNGVTGSSGSLTAETWVPLGCVIAACGVVGGAAWREAIMRSRLSSAEKVADTLALSNSKIANKLDEYQAAALAQMQELQKQSSMGFQQVHDMSERLDRIQLDFRELRTIVERHIEALSAPARTR